jgi:hypothetical protein
MTNPKGNGKIVWIGLTSHFMAYHSCYNDS